jgi:heme exporter protein CcmD
MSYVWAGYGVTLATLAGYAAWLLRRGRKLR